MNEQHSKNDGRKKIQDALRDAGYHLGNQYKLPANFRPKTLIDAWVGNGPIILVQRFTDSDGNDMGFDVFAPVTDDGEIEATLQAMLARISKGGA